MRASVVASEDAFSGARRVTRFFLLLLTLAACGREEIVDATPAPQPRVACVNDWTRAGDGIEYRMLNCTPRGFDLHLVRVDPQKLDAVMRSGNAESFGFRFAINANFFDEQFRPLGIVRSGGRDLNGAHPVSWQSIFYVTRDGKAGIVRTKEWSSVKSDVRMAVQAGPRLIVNGERNQVARATPDLRSGVCLDATGRPIFFATPPEAAFDVWQTIDLAAAMDCRQAMLFDGGPSTQMFLRGRVELTGDKRVPAFVIAR